MELIIIKTKNSQELQEFLKQKQINYEIYNTEEEEVRKQKWLADYKEQAKDTAENQEIEEWDDLESSDWND